MVAGGRVILDSRWEELGTVLDEIESHFSWYPQYQKPLVERIRQIGQALLSLKEIEYFGWARTGDFYERVDNMIDDVLARLTLPVQ